MPAVAEESVVSPIRSGSSDAYHGNIVNEEHDGYENRKSEPAVCDNLIDLVGGGKLAGVLFFVAALNKGSYVDITLVCDDAFRIVVKLIFGGFDVFVYVSQRICGDVELFENLVIVLKDLYRIPTLLFCGHVVYRSLLDVCDRVLNGAREVVHRNGLCVLCGIDCGICGFHDSRAFECGDLDHLAAELTRKLRSVDLIAVFLYDVHHVDGDHHRDSELGELRCEVKVSFEVGSVDDVEYCIGTFTDEVVSCNDLFKGVGGKRVNTRKVGDRYAVVLFEFSFFFLDGDTGPVSDELI